MTPEKSAQRPLTQYWCPGTNIYIYIIPACIQWVLRRRVSVKSQNDRYSLNKIHNNSRYDRSYRASEIFFLDEILLYTALPQKKNVPTSRDTLCVLVSYMTYSKQMPLLGLFLANNILSLHVKHMLAKRK